ncbi:MAG TPA: DNA recombination protein RmuC [Candidatus Sulfotelmatobacter sp.]|nr:DNA recombination protein RmuC [Candidatus Sulfotelmatobacter sp.]
MEAVLIGIVILLAGLVVWLVLQNSKSPKDDGAVEGQVAELRRDLQVIASAQAQTAGNIQAISQSVTQRLDGVSTALRDGVTHSAQIASAGQTAIANELKNTREQIGLMQRQLGEVQEQSRGLSAATQSLEMVLGGAKTRGLLGEVTLQRMLEDSLPPSQFAMQYRFSSGEVADAVIFLRDEKLMAVDSKFPLEAFRRIANDGDDARRAFATAVKGHADSIAKKYIVPNEGTLDVALMFVPSENVYCEMLGTTDNRGVQLDEYCRGKNIVAVSPNSLYAHLCVIAMGLKGMQIEENAKRLLANLNGVQKNMGTFAEVFEKLGTHLKNAQQSYSEADRRFEKAQNTLENVLSGGTPPAAIEGEQLPLGIAAGRGNGK